MGQVVCPGREELAAFDRGELPAEAAETLAAHVEGCASCQEALGALTHRADPLLDGLQQAGRATAGQGAAPAPPGYELLGEVGRGGMGVVYRARDLRLAREVAVKLLRQDYPADSAACARFLAEAQVTGQLQHPGVPAVHELGRLPDGRPFLAMKLVRGRTLHDLLRERSDPGHERGRFVAAFEQVCQAVGYAHAHRVIHRDLKPGNVMVGAFGEVQVMDWGLAKVLPAEGAPEVAADELRLAETLPVVTAIETPPGADSATRTGAVLGTPAYMPPEQAGGEVRKLDARSDVFGLGAILCQILTGLPPYQGKDVHEVRLRAVRGDLREALTRLDGCGAEPDLVALCKRCLAFRQEDRPADGQAVAQEVARLRAAAEERARRAELERAEALVREAEQRKRRRQLLTAATVVAAVLVAGIVGTTFGLVRARDAAEAERRANEQAQGRLKQVEKGNDLLTSVFTDLDMNEIKQGPDPLEAVLARRLVGAAGQLEGEAVGDPLVVARLQDRLGRSLLALGHARPAADLFEKALATRSELLGADDPDTLSSVGNLAEGYEHAGQLEKALPLHEEALRRRKARLGADHPDTLVSMNNLAGAYHAHGEPDRAVPLFEETLRLSRGRLGADHARTLATLNNLAVGYGAAGQRAKALEMYEEVLRLLKDKLGADHPYTIGARNNLAVAYRQAGRLSEALPLYEEVLRLTEALRGPDHPDTLLHLYNLAVGYKAAGQLDKAVPLLEKVLRLRKARLGTEHPETLQTMNSLAGAYDEAGQTSRALPLYEETLRLQKARLGPDHPDTLQTMNDLAVAYQGTGLRAKALPFLEEALRLRKAKLGPDHPDTLESLNNLAGAYHTAGRREQALALWEEALGGRRAKLGPDHPATLSTLSNLAAGYFAAGQRAKALPLCEEVLRGRRARLGPDHPDTLASLANLATAYCAAKQGEKAVPLFAEYLAHQRQRAKPNDPGFAGQLVLVAGYLLAGGRYPEAEAYLREGLAIRRQTSPDAWETFHTTCLLGGALLGQKKYADAEPLLRAGYEGMKQREAKAPPAGKARLTEAAGWLVALYQAWGKPDEAAKWRQELARRKGAESRPKD